MAPGAPGCCFVQLSDPHLTSLADVAMRDVRGKRVLGYLSWRRRRRHEHRGEVLELLVAHLRGEASDQLLVTGDLTHIGLPGEFREAARWLRRLGAPSEVAVVPGNHEFCALPDPSAGLELWGGYLAGDDGASQFPTLRTRAGVAFIGVSSAVVTPTLFATGRVGTQQRGRLAELLRACERRGLFRVVYLHHCPVPGIDRWRKRLVDAPEVSRVLSECGVELVLHGHGHRSLSSRLATAAGFAPVLAVPSASAAGMHGESAGYRRFAVRPGPGGWMLSVAAYRYDPAGGTIKRRGPGEEHWLERRHAAAEVAG